MLRRKKAVFFLLSLLGLQMGMQSNFLNGYWSGLTARRTISLATISAALIGAYKFGPQVYRGIQDKINNEFNEEVVRCLVLVITPNCFIHQLKDSERDDKFKKKAWLMSSRDRIRNRLVSLLDCSNQRLSGAHKKQLSKTLNELKVVFGSVDFMDSGMSFLISNPYDYTNSEPGYINKIIENRIFESVILSTKPLNECTTHEKQQRIQSKQNIRKVIMKKIGNMSDAFLAQIDQIVGMLFA